MMNFIKSSLVYLATMYAVLCFHMAIAQTANESLPVSYKKLNIGSGESNEAHQIGLYSFASADLRESIIKLQGTRQSLPAPDKFIIAQQTSNSNWWFAVKYYRTGSPNECIYIKEAIAYNDMISKLDNYLPNLLDLENYNSEDGGDFSTLLKHINQSISNKLEFIFNVTTENSDAEETYNSKKDVVETLFKDCNTINNLSDSVIELPNDTNTVPSGHSGNDNTIASDANKAERKTVASKLGSDGAQEQKPYWLKWLFLGTLIVLLIIAVIVIGFLFYRKVTRLFDKLSNLEETYRNFDKLANNLEHTYWDYKRIDLGNVKNDMADVRTAQLEQQASLDSIDSKIDEVKKLAKLTADFSDNYSKSQEQSRALDGELMGWFKKQIEESLKAGKEYANLKIDLESVTGENLTKGTNEQINYYRSYKNIGELSSSMQNSCSTTGRDANLSQTMQLLMDHFKHMHSFILMLLCSTRNSYAKQKENKETLTQEKDKIDKNFQALKSNFQALKSQAANLKKVNQQIYRQGGLHLSEEENNNITLEKLVELGNLYSEHQAIQQYVLAMNALKDRLSSPSSTKEPFFRAVELDVLIDKLNGISNFRKFYERDELSDILIGHWKQYIRLIFRACLLINSYFKLDRHHPILIDLKLAKSAAEKLLKEHDLIPDYFELPVASDKIEGEFQIAAYNNIPSDLADYDGFKNKVQDLHRSGVDKAVCYVNEWGLSSQKSELCIDTVLASLERSNRIVQDWGD